MKKKKQLGVMLIILLAATISACGENKEESKISQTTEQITEQITEQTKEQTTEQPSQTDIPMLEFYEGITGMKAETEAYADLEKLIIKYYEIPEEFLELSSYYYNYVDFNDDGKKEIFVVVNGAYTSGSGGSSALWVSEKDGVLQVNQDFTLVNTPIIVSDKKTNGAHELVFPYYGGGAESHYKILTYSDGLYININDAQSVETWEGITGKAIIANDLIGEISNGIEGLKLKK